MKKANIRGALDAAATAVTVLMLSTAAWAAGNGDLENSDFAVGTANLLSDIGSWLIGIGLTVGSVAAVYCIIRRGMADEVDGKMWTKRIIIAIICAVAVALVGGIITLISSYYTSSSTAAAATTVAAVAAVIP